MEVRPRHNEETAMMIYPELTLALVHDRQRELVAEADRGRLLRSARQWSRSTSENVVSGPAAMAGTARTHQELRQVVVVSAGRSRGDGSVTTCVPRAAAPAGR
jgi:hypothetical protein